MTMESLLGVALTLRGASADFLLCDGLLPACMMCEVNWYADLESFARTGPRDRCHQCHDPASKMLDAAGFSHFGFNSHLSISEIEESRQLANSIAASDISSFRIDGIAIGEHAFAGTLRFLACGTLGKDPASELVLRRYLESALLTYFAVKRILSANDYDVIVLNHGIYVPQGVVAELARSMGIRVVTWHLAYRKRCFIFNHDETYHQGLLSEPVSNWESMTWSKAHAREIEQYLQSRWIGKQDWIKFHRHPKFDVAAIHDEIGIDFSRPTIGLLTNVAWDAQLHYRANAFPDMMDWLNKTIAYFSDRPDLQLLIRVHPAEVTGSLPSRQRVVDEIAKVFPVLPPNIFIIPPESNLSTYVSMSQCNAALVYGTKMGVELAATGIPVIVAGEAWIRGKGITSDANSESEYFELLHKLPFDSRLDEVTRSRALKYAYHFFFRRMIPFDCMKAVNGWPPFRVASNGMTDLLSGNSKGLDVVCDGILSGTPFIYPAENMSHSDVE